MEDWLRAIGLADRIEAFRAQRIASDDLAELTDGELRELGLTIGERKRFRRGLASLGSAGLAEPLAAPKPADRAATAAITAERRPLTMMFVDLVNSSGLAQQLEVEDLLEVIRAYREFCGAAVMRYGGHIARFVGDGILAYFCYPVANENDPERAVRASLDIVAGVGRVASPAGAPLSVRIGIATGRVIVSDLFAGGEADRQSIIGSTPNLAARLQSLASVDGVVVADETHRRVAHLFECVDLGQHAVRGFESSQSAWRVLRELRRQERLALARPARLMPLRGRAAELDVLRASWAAARDGAGRAVLLAGEAGIGKSRLLEEFLAEHVGHAAIGARLSATPLNVDSPFHPLIGHLRSTLGIDGDGRGKLGRLGSRLDAAEQRSLLPTLAPLLGIQSGLPLPRSAKPERIREQLLAFMQRELLATAQNAPACIVFEDVHWLDPSSLEVLSHLLEGIAGRPLLVLLTARPDFDPAQIGGDPTVLRLAPLDSAELGLMIDDLLAARAIPQELMDQIARRTDGVPLFVQEYVRTLLQAGESTGVLDGQDSAVPASIHELLMSRLDRTGAAKQVAQVASVVGRTIRRGLLAALSAADADALGPHLATLTESGVLLCTEVDGEECFSFSHELLRDAAYESLLRDRRRELHLRVARALTELDQVRVEQQPELLALHLSEGGAAEEAAGLWMEAARRSLSRSALTEATRLLRRGLTGLAAIEPSPRVASLRLQLSGLLGPALIALKGPGADETHDFYNDAVALCRETVEEPAHFPIYWGWWRVSRDFRSWVHRAVFLREMAEVRRDPEFMLQAHHCNWASHYHVGELSRCREHIAAGLELYRGGDYRHHAQLFGNHDPKVCGHGELALVHWLQGRPASALREEEPALAWATGLDHLGSRVHAMDIALTHRVMRRDHREVLRHSRVFIDFASEHGISDHRAKGFIFQGWTRALNDCPKDGLAMLREGFAMQQDIGTSEDFPIYVCLLAEALIASGKPELAIEELRKATKRFEEIGLRAWLPEVLRVTAEATLAAGSDARESARTLLDEAARIAAEQEAAMLGLRVAVSRARLALREGDRIGARAIVVPAIAAIEEPEGCEDVKIARALQAEIRGGQPRATG